LPKPLKPKAQSRPPLAAAAVLALLVLLAYANSFSAGFVFDNRVLLLEDTRLHAVSTSNLDLILHKPYWWPFIDTPLYRPATTLSYLLNYSVFGNADRPFGYHVVNWLLHTANVWLVFALALRIGRRIWPALFIAALWAVHPLATEAVTNIVGRADLLAAFGVLAAFYAHLESRDARGAGRWAWTAASVAALTVAVFSKESAVAGVGVVVLYDLLFRERSSRLSRLVQGWIILVLPAALFLYARSTVLGAAPAEVPYVDNPIAGASFWTGRLTALSVMGRYLAVLVWPIRLSADYSFSQIPLATGTAGDWLAWIALIVLAVLALMMLKVSRVVCFCLAGAFITFLPAANLLFPTGTIMAERLMYLPSAFLVGAGVAAIDSFATVVGWRAFAPALVSLAIVFCAVRTFARNADWQDDLALWTATAQTAPNSFKSHGSLAEALYRSDPAHNNLGQVIAEKEKSLAILKAAPDPAALSKPYEEAATYYLEHGDWLQDHHASGADIADAYRRAAALGEQYLRLAAQHPVSAKEMSDARLLVSTAYARLQDGDKALVAAREAASDQPFNPMSYRATAAALLNTRQVDEAAVELMTGFMVTGNQALRTALLDLYRGGLDRQGCATTANGPTVILNVSCEIVRRHLCEAAARANDLQRRAGHPELASQVAVFTRDARCETLTK
jgi:hypothetical protein